MTFDERRNSAYLKALKQVVTPDSVVLDLGAGLGMLGLQAAKLGAKRVYLVEPEDVISVTREIVKVNGFDDRVVCLQGKIEKVDIPEPVDVIISVFTGNFLLGEDLLPSLFFARDRYLKPGGVLIPNAAIMEAAPVSAPETFKEVIDVWSTPQLGIDQSPARTYANQQIYWYGKELKKAQYLAIPEPLMELDFYTATQTHCQTQISYAIKDAGCCHGFAGWFKMQLGDSWLSTAPHEPPLHWSVAYLPLDPPLEVTQGDDLTFRLTRPTYGDWTWQVALNDQRQQRSTFFATPMTMKTLRQQSPDYQPSLNDKGAAALFVLSHSNRSLSTKAMAEQLVIAYSQQFPDLRKAMNFVQGLIGSFSH
ncbi:50S ribosomal protein L11 methyltransferase [Leptolyngbya subtilissima]|uniref:50S ribosomal protein L11 methyltransferase n=2 Tax=Cyanophyceae TaxID=3028117 RepID=A0ABV0JZ74_9CYAN